MDLKSFSKQQEEDFAEYQKRKQKRNQKKVSQKVIYAEKLFNPLLKNNIVSWVDEKCKGKIYNGFIGEELVFEIKRGIVSFSLKIVHKELKYKKVHSSTELFALQKKANNIIQLNKDFLRKLKTIS